MSLKLASAFRGEMMIVRTDERSTAGGDTPGADTSSHKENDMARSYLPTPLLVSLLLV